jgi:hypothetical protein
MAGREKIDQYDLVEIIQVPEVLAGIVDIGDIGVVVEKHNDRNCHVECVQPGGPSKWLATLNVRYIRLRSKDPYSKWVKRSQDRTLMQKSVTSGAKIGAVFGLIIGAVFGAVTTTVNGVLIGAVVGSILGTITGVPTAALTAKIAGTTGGIGVGYFIGMVFGGVLGLILGALVPPSRWTSAQTEGVPVLGALMRGRIETAISASFLLSVLATIVGSWIAGNNLASRNLNDK